MLLSSDLLLETANTSLSQTRRISSCVRCPGFLDSGDAERTDRVLQLQNPCSG